MKKLPRLDLNPSSADRWTTCTASSRFILENWDKVPVSSDTIYNIEGSAAHEVASAFIQDRKPNPEYGKEYAIKEYIFTPEMYSHAWNYMEYVLALQEKGHITEVEKKYPLWYMPERNAMVDAAVLNPRNLHIVDYKYGEGIPVSPVENLQGAIYARSVIRQFNNGEGLAPEFPVFIHIYQPRGRNAEAGPAHVWETTWGELREFTEDRVSSPADIILDGTNPKRQPAPPLEFAPSDKACQWCPAKGFCTARMKHLTGDFDNLDLMENEAPTFPIVGTMSVEQRALVQKHGSEIVKWVEGVKEYNQQQAELGNILPGYKLVLSRGGNRYWSDPQKAAQLLVQDTILKREEVIEETVIGPAAVEKKLGKNKFSAELTNLIAKAPGAPVIAPVEDKRPAITNALSEFSPVGEDEDSPQ